MDFLDIALWELKSKVLSLVAQTIRSKNSHNSEMEKRLLEEIKKSYKTLEILSTDKRVYNAMKEIADIYAFLL